MVDHDDAVCGDAERCGVFLPLGGELIVIHRHILVYTVAAVVICVNQAVMVLLDEVVGPAYELELQLSNLPLLADGHVHQPPALHQKDVAPS